MNYAKLLPYLLFCTCLLFSGLPLAKAQTSSLARGYQLLYEGKILSPDGGALQIFSALLADGTETEKAREGLSRIARLAVSRTQKGQYKEGVSIIKALAAIQAPELDADVKEAAASIASSLNQQGTAMLKDGRCVSAKRICEQALALNPGDSKMEKSLAQARNATGSLAIYSNPWGEVFIDGKKTKHIAPVDGVLLLCGKYQVEIRQPKGEKADATVKINTGQRTRLVMNSGKLEVMED